MHKILTAAALAAISFNVNASPVELNLTGTVTDGSGSRVGDIGTGVTANLIIDLDPANAALYKTDAPVGEPEYSSWYFTVAPYAAVATGSFGTITGSSVWIETLDDFDADAFGNPFGISGVVDVLSMFGSNDIVDCTGGTVDPITGCSIEGAPVLSGEEFSVNLIYNSSWFTGTGETDLPTYIPAFANLIGVYGNGTFAASGSIIGENEMTYTSMTVSTVPIPAAVWMFGSALGLLGWMQRKKKS